MLGRVGDFPLAVIEVEVVLVPVKRLIFKQSLFVLERQVLLAIASLRRNNESI